MRKSIDLLLEDYVNVIELESKYALPSATPLARTIVAETVEYDPEAEDGETIFRGED